MSCAGRLLINRKENFTYLLGLGCVLAGAAVSTYSYMKTLDRDRTIGRELLDQKHILKIENTL